MSLTPTVAACLTPAGTAAIAVIGVHGSAAWPIVRELLNRPDSPDSSSNRLVRITDGEQSDRVVVTRPTEDLVELHCHGGVGVVRWILGLLEKRGVIEIDWEEWLRRTAPSPLRSDAAVTLARAPTVRTARILLDQLHGACERAIHGVLRALEEQRTTDAREQLGDLVARIPLGRHLTTPWRVVLAGSPNVGKSTLLNALLGFERAISSPTPGTTRDVVRSTTAFDGWPVELVDTAGLRESARVLEAAGVERARRELSVADLVLWVLDASQPPVLPRDETKAGLLFVINKVDLTQTWSQKDRPDLAEACPVSARTGEGLDALAKRVVQALVPSPPEPGAAVPVGETVGKRLEAAGECLHCGDVFACHEELASLLGPSCWDDASSSLKPHCARQRSQ